jgi:hypothetical protein
LMDNERTLLDVRVDYARARADIDRATADLERALGIAAAAPAATVVTEGR